MTDVLGRSVIEVGVDEMRLADEMSGAQRTIAKSLAESLNRTKLEKNERLKLYEITKSLAHLDMSRVKLQAVATERVNKSLRQTVTSLKEASRLTLTPAGRALLSDKRTTNPYHTVSQAEPNNIMAGFGKMGAVLAGAAGAGVGLTFAGAVAAGSTTFDTLTGSLKMLSLAAGAKTQGPVLKLSALIQQLAKATEQAPNGMVGGISGGLSGGLLGLKFGGPLGGLIGAGIGGLAGGAFEKGVNDFADKRNMVEKLKADPNHVVKLLKEIQDLEKAPFANVPFFGNQVEIAKRKGAIRQFEAKRDMEKDELKTAGLGGTGQYVGLSDLRQQTQIAGFGPGGVLGLENELKELNQNLRVANQQGAANQRAGGAGNVAPPGG